MPQAHQGPITMLSSWPAGAVMVEGFTTRCPNNINPSHESILGSDLAVNPEAWTGKAHMFCILKAFGIGSLHCLSC